MKKSLYTDDDNFSCFGIILLIALLVFAGPLIVMFGWNAMAAGMFALPTMPYWTAFWVTNACQILFGAKNVMRRD